MLAPFRLAFTESIMFQVVGMADMVHIRKEGIVLFVQRQPADGDPTEPNTMISPFPADDHGLFRIANMLLISHDDLHDRIHRLGPGIGEKDILKFV